MCTRGYTMQHRIDKFKELFKFYRELDEKPELSIEICIFLKCKINLGI